MPRPARILAQLVPKGQESWSQAKPARGPSGAWNGRPSTVQTPAIPGLWALRMSSHVLLWTPEHNPDSKATFHQRDDAHPRSRDQDRGWSAPGTQRELRARRRVVFPGGCGVERGCPVIPKGGDRDTPDAGGRLGGNWRSHGQTGETPKGRPRQRQVTRYPRTMKARMCTYMYPAINTDDLKDHVHS